MQVIVEELGLGDVFLFRGQKYAVIANIINDHTPEVAHVICGGMDNVDMVYILVLHTKFKVERAGHIPISCEVIKMTDEELAT